jgi:hypothetical protein
MIFGLFWVNIAISAPKLYTSAFGEIDIMHDVVKKKKTSSRRSCDYRLEPRSINTAFFHYCISESDYNRLPGDEIKSELLLKKSSFGYIVKHIRVTNK